MTTWNSDAVSQQFLVQAEDAERYLQEVRVKVKSNSSYQHVHDEHLARFYVFNYLHGRTFLASRDALLKELQSMAAHAIPAPREAYEGERFGRYRQQYVNLLISQFSSESL